MPQQRAAAVRPSNVRWLIFALSCMTSLVLYLHRYTWGFVKADVQKEFGWSEWQLGLLDGLFNASYAAGQIPSGILCDWFGPHVLLGSIILLWSLAMGGVTVATGFNTMAAARILFGITQAGCYPTLGKVTKLWFPLSLRTTVQGWIATFFGRGGGALSFLVVGTVLMGWLELSWRMAILVLTVAGILFGVLFALLFRNTPQDHPYANDAEVELITEGRPERTQATRSTLRWRGILKSRNIPVLFVQQFTSAYADNVFVYWIPMFLLTVKQIDVKNVGWMAALPLIGGAVGGMVGATLQDYLIRTTGNRRWARNTIGMVGKLLATVFMFVSLSFDAAVTIIWLFTLLKFFGDWSQPTAWGTITDIAGRNPASVFASVNTVGSIAAFIAGPTMGLLIMGFSQTRSVTEALANVVQVSGNEAELALEHRSLAGPLRGSVYVGDSLAATFEVDKQDAFQIAGTGAGPAQAMEEGSHVNRAAGTLTIAWNGPPPESLRVVVDYSYTHYGSGWTALFIVLCAVYLVSALSWLFIDCTQPLEGEDDA